MCFCLLVILHEATHLYCKLAFDVSAFRQHYVSKEIENASMFAKPNASILSVFPPLKIILEGSFNRQISRGIISTFQGNKTRVNVFSGV